MSSSASSAQSHAAFTPGLIAALIAVVFWGLQLPLAKSAMGPDGFDPYTLSNVRYGLAALPLLLYWFLVSRHTEAHDTAWPERWAVLRLGLGWMALSPLCVFVGLGMTLPEQAAIIIALQPTMMAVVNWLKNGVRPAPFTLGCIVVALFGVICVVTKLQPLAALTPRYILGASLVFLGALFWVLYTQGAARYHHWPSLKLTTFTLSGCAVTMIVANGSALAIGAAHWPSGALIAQWWPTLLFLGLGGVLLAMLLWTRGVKRIGALNALLLLNLVPVLTFAVRFAQGARFAPVELFGAALVVGALVANNLHARQQHQKVMLSGLKTA